MAPITIHDLPNEILAQILSHVDSPAASSTRLHEQPTLALLSSRELSLKNASLVSRRWRAIGLPILYRHVAWSFNRGHLPDLHRRHLSSPDDLTAAIPLLDVLLRHKLTGHVESLSLCVGESPVAEAPLGLVAGLTKLDGQGYEEGAPLVPDCNWLWRVLFEHLRPKRFTIIATPRTLANLMGRKIFLGDAWSFETGPHILSLELPSKGEPPPPAPPPIPWKGAANGTEAPCDLFTLRPWTSLLVNEGSSTRAYRTYEFFLKRPPTILYLLLGATANAGADASLPPPSEWDRPTPLMPATVRSLSYVAVFPLSTHFNNTLIQNLPTLDQLYVQLVPRDALLRDPGHPSLRHVDPSDLWMERNTCYSLLMRELFDPAAGTTWHDVAVFESGDAADREAWQLAVNYVTRDSTRGWRVERDGVFVRDQVDEAQRVRESGSGNGAGAGDAHAGPTTYRNKLWRVAFAGGVTRLPLSSMWLYLDSDDHAADPQDEDG